MNFLVWICGFCLTKPSQSTIMIPERFEFSAGKYLHVVHSQNDRITSFWRRKYFRTHECHGTEGSFFDIGDLLCGWSLQCAKLREKNLNLYAVYKYALHSRWMKLCSRSRFGLPEFAGKIQAIALESERQQWSALCKWRGYITLSYPWKTTILQSYCR